MVAGKVGDLSEVRIGGKSISGVLAETYIVAARAEWGYAASKAKDINFISNEVENVKAAIAEYELEVLVNELSSGAGNTFTAATAGTLAYADLVKAREYNRVDGFEMEFVAVNPAQMSDLLKDSTLLDSALSVGFSGSVWKTKLGWEIFEANKLTAATAYGFGKKFATFVEKSPLEIIHYDAGKSGDARLAKGVIAWEMFDIVTMQANAACKITGC